MYGYKSCECIVEGIVVFDIVVIVVVQFVAAVHSGEKLSLTKLVLFQSMLV